LFFTLLELKIVARINIGAQNCFTEVLLNIHDL